jgi:hypothetical protein
LGGDDDADQHADDAPDYGHHSELAHDFVVVSRLRLHDGFTSQLKKETNHQTALVAVQHKTAESITFKALAAVDIDQSHLLNRSQLHTDNRILLS